MSRMDEWGRTARRLVVDERLTEEEREQQFVAEALLDLRRIVGVADAEQYSRAGSIAYSWHGLARYWRKRPASRQSVWVAVRGRGFAGSPWWFRCQPGRKADWYAASAAHFA